MPLRERKYKYNQSILKIFGYGENKKIKIITMNCMRNPGIEDECKVPIVKGSVNNEKLEENIKRAKSKIFELAYCNPWGWFFTATLNKDKHNRTDLESFHKNITRFIMDYNSKYKLHIKFLLIPELHEDGMSWHMHGLINGLPVDHLKQFHVGDVMGKNLADKVKKGDEVYNWKSYLERFGFCDLEPIRSPEAVSKYITKYINKNLASSVTKLNAHLYYVSRGLKTAQTIKKGTMLADIVPDFENDYCRITWMEYSDELLKSLSDSFLR